ncbi:MAG: hypothetical protein E6593_06595 [Clostridium sp.]|nr:hypothetical protein [Clostridium sp.]
MFLIVGAGMLSAGIVYLRKEKDDPDSVKIYRVVSILGSVLVAVALLTKFVF